MDLIASSDERDELLSQWCAIVDQREKRVVHIHQFIPADESALLSEDDLARQALEHAPLTLDRDGIYVVHPEPDTPLEPDFRYSIDRDGRLEGRRVERQRESSPRSRRERWAGAGSGTSEEPSRST